MSDHFRSQPFFDIYLRTCDGSDDLSSHNHYYHQVILVTEGLVQFQIGGKYYLAKPNSFFLISNFESHSMKVLQYPYKRYILAINSEFAAIYLRHPLLLSVFLRRPENFDNLINLDNSIAKDISEICRNMIMELNPRKILWEENVAAMVMQLLILVYRYSSEPFWPAITSSLSKLISNVQNFISINYHNKLSLEDLSKEFNVSKFYLSRIFKTITGFNYKDYLIRYRLNIAKDFLINSKMAITEISTACGYDSINHFNKIFKIYEGVTPSSYRKNAKSVLLE